MTGEIKALIFDMDGVLINSEGLWRKAMVIGFGEGGLPVTEEQCRQTMGMRFPEVVKLWLAKYPDLEITSEELERTVVDRLVALIREEGKVIPGIPEIIALCKRQQLLKGVATSSSNELMRVVLKKLDLEPEFNATVSAEFMAQGKPHPEVFLTCAAELGVEPSACLVIEDSLNGVLAAKAAGMKVIAVPEDGMPVHPGLSQADWQFSSMPNAYVFLENLFTVKNPA